MPRIETRIKALEARCHRFVPWLRIIQENGQTQDQAIAAWESANGREVGNESRIIMRVIDGRAHG